MRTSALFLLAVFFFEEGLYPANGFGVVPRRDGGDQFAQGRLGLGDRVFRRFENGQGRIELGHSISIFGKRFHAV